MALNAKIIRWPDLSYEKGLFNRDCTHIAGIDEAGRGAWAGPVVAAAVILPIERDALANTLKGVRDSKQMTFNQRAHWAIEIRKTTQWIGVGQASPEEIDQCGLIPATCAAMRRALQKLPLAPDYLLIDYMHLPDVPYQQTAITHGDALVLSIAAASVIAKVARDQMMIGFDSIYPGFAFASNKGYGTPAHRKGLEQLGPTPIHRFSYRPLAKFSRQKALNSDK
jgi:ribonuclease HII